MQTILTQKNRLKPDKQTEEVLRNLSTSCTRLYNVGLYSVKCHYEKTSEYLNYAKNYHECKNNEHYKLLLTDCGQQILRIVERNMKSFFALLRLKNKGKYSDKVSLPHFKKTESLSSIVFQGRSARMKNGYVYLGLSKAFQEKYKPPFKKLKFKLPRNIKAKRLQEVTLIPKFGGKRWDICFVYKKEFEVPKSENGYLSIDLGINNFATCFNGQNGNSFILDGKHIKSVNQHYNKTKTKLKINSNKFCQISTRRTNRIEDVFRKYANYVVKYCRENKIGYVVIGELNKEKMNIGKVNNQKFAYIAYAKFISKLKHKCSVNGIELHLQEERYTSKCSFLDKEKVCQHDVYRGKRVKRGLFRTSENVLVNADVNGAANILVKFLSKHRAFSRVSSGFVNNPVRVSL